MSFEKSLKEWKAYLANCTDKQVVGVYETERVRMVSPPSSVETAIDSRAAVEACQQEARARKIDL